jgi:N utilization substance protein A
VHGSNIDAGRSTRERIEIEHVLKEIPGVTKLMCSVLAAHGIKSIEDLASCATDDLTGWLERRRANTIRHRGILDGFALSRKDCETLILNARIKAGWISSPPERTAAQYALKSKGAIGVRLIGKSVNIDKPSHPAARSAKYGKS